MIKVNLLAQTRREAAPKKGPSISLEGIGNIQNILIIVLIVATAVFMFWKWRDLSSINADLDVQIADAQEQLKKVEEDKRVVEELERKRRKVEHQIDLIAQLKKAQQVPVRLLDEISRNLPDFLWLVSLNENNGSLTFSGRATTPTAYANFYNNLDASPFFKGVGRISYRDDGAQGVSFSLAAQFVPNPEQGQAPAAAAAEGAL
jgi:type IV pilus assembly protein PilN